MTRLRAAKELPKFLFQKGSDKVSHEEMHEHSGSSGSSVFTPAECAAMHEADKQAAKGIVLLMTGVFTLGLIMYLYIAWVI
jgi:hypothetical protein